MKPIHYAMPFALIICSPVALAVDYNFGDATVFEFFDNQVPEIHTWDTGDSLIADFHASGSAGHINGSRNALLTPEVSIGGNTIIPEVRADTRSGLRYSADIHAYAGAVISAGMTRGGPIDGKIGLGPSLSLPDQIRAGRFFSMQGESLVDHGNLDIALPSINAGLDLVIGGNGTGTIEYGLFPVAPYYIGDFNFNLPDINLPVINFNLDLNLPQLPEFNFLNIPDLIPDSDKDNTLFSLKLPPGNPLLSAGEVELVNPASSAGTQTAMTGGTLVSTTKGELARIGLDVDGIVSFASTGVSFTGLTLPVEAGGTKLGDVSYDTLDVKYGLELGYEVENRLDSYLEATLSFFDTQSGEAVSVLMRDADGTQAIDTYAGRWDELPDFALLGDSDVDIDIDFTGLKRELGQRGSLTLSDYMELKLLASKASIKFGPSVELGPLLYKKLALAGELGSFEVYDTSLTLTDLGLTTGLWDETISLDAIENQDVYLASVGGSLDNPAAFRLLDDHSEVTSLADKTLVIGTADASASRLADISPIDYVDEGATRSAQALGWDIYNSTSLEVTVTGVQDAGQILQIGGLLVQQGASYTNTGIRRFDLFSVENDGVIANQGWLDFQAPNGQMVISGTGTIFFASRDENPASGSGSISADGLFHGEGHTLDFGPGGQYNGNLDARVRASLHPDYNNTPYVDDNDIADLMPDRRWHTIDVANTLQNQGLIRSRSFTTLNAGKLVNDVTGVIEGKSMNLTSNTEMINRGLIEGGIVINSPAIKGSQDAEDAGAFRVGYQNSEWRSMVFLTPASNSDLDLSGNLDFIASNGGSLIFETGMDITENSLIKLNSDAGGIIQLNGIHREAESGRIIIDNKGLLEVVTGVSSLRNTTKALCPPGVYCPPSPSAVIAPIDLNNEGTVRVHRSAQFAFDVDIVDYSEGGATLSKGSWEVFGANTRYANTDSGGSTSQTATLDMRVKQVFGNAGSFGDLIFDESGVSELDTRLVYNNANVTLSGAARFKYFNTVEVNRGNLKLLNQHQFNTASGYENRGGTTLVDSGAGLHVNGALRVNGGQVTFTGSSELSVAGTTEVLEGGANRRRDIEVNGGTLSIGQGTQVDSGLISRSRSDGLVLQSGRSWIVRDSVTENAGGNEVVTAGRIDLDVRSNNGAYGIIRNDADVELAGQAAQFHALESKLRYQHGTLTVADGKVFESSNTYFRNAGEMNLRAGQFLLKGGEFRNDGVLNIDIASYFSVDHLNLVSGVANIEGVVDAVSAAVNSEVNLFGGIFNSESIQMGSAGVFMVEGGTLLTNSLDGSLFVDSGIFAPGQSIGTANIMGDYTQSSEGLVEIEWGALGADMLNIANVGYLNGDVHLTLLDGFLPKAGDSIEFLTAASIQGMFKHDVLHDNALSDLGFALRYDSNSVFLDVYAASEVPLPPAAWLFLSALLGLVCRARKHASAEAGRRQADG